MRGTNGARCLKLAAAQIVEREGLNMAKYIFEKITEDTVRTAREKLLDKLQEITSGNAQEALDLAAAYAELDSILKANEEQHEKPKDLTFEKMLG